MSLNPGEVLVGIAELFNFPGDARIQSMAEFLATMSRHEFPRCSLELEEFSDSLEGVGQERLELNYINTFDVSSGTCPYAGVLLYGDGIERRELVEELKRTYEASFFLDDTEQPDHYMVMLRFIAQNDPASSVVTNLVKETVHPSLGLVLEAFEKNGEDNPYCHLMKAIQYLMYVIAPPVEHPRGGSGY